MANLAAHTITRPSFRRYVELPITVRHAWEGYGIVDQALISLEQGQFQEAALLSDAVYTDDRVIGCLSTRINGLFGLPLEFKYPGQDGQHSSVKPVAPSDPADGDDAPTERVGPSNADDDKAMELKKTIVGLVEANWEKMIPGAAAREQMRWGILLNAGLGELVWDWGRDGILWPTLKTWNSQFLYWRWDTKSYWLIHQDGQTEVRAGDGRWVLFSPTGHNHGWLYGIIRALGKLWLDRVFAFRDWARASEKYSLGILKGKVPANASASDKRAFENAMTNLPNESFVLLPQMKKEEGTGFDVEMMETDSAVNWQTFKERVHQLDTSIAVCLLGQNLSTEVSGSGGSRAAAQVHDNVRGDFLKADDEIWSSMVRTQILTPWVSYNFGDLIAAMGREVTEFVPEVTHKVEPPEDLEKQSKAIFNIAQAIQGLAGTEADIHALLDDHGIPVIDARETPDEPTPGADVNERPPAPAQTTGEDGVTRPPGEDATLSRLALARRRVGSKPGQRKGRVFSDDLVDVARQAAVTAMESRKKALLHICSTASSYDEMKGQIKRLYQDVGPSELRSIMEKSLATAQLLGRLSARVDHRHG